VENVHGRFTHHPNLKSKLFSIEKMILLIIKLAQAQDWYGVSETVEIAKGENQYAQSWGQVKNTYKRKFKSWQKK
jgi:hypothetical protein